jgi:hypothetical protein
MTSRLCIDIVCVCPFTIYCVLTFIVSPARTYAPFVWEILWSLTGKPVALCVGG